MKAIFVSSENFVNENRILFANFDLNFDSGDNAINELFDTSKFEEYFDSGVNAINELFVISKFEVYFDSGVNPIIELFNDNNFFDSAKLLPSRSVFLNQCAATHKCAIEFFYRVCQGSWPL